MCNEGMTTQQRNSRFSASLVLALAFLAYRYGLKTHSSYMCCYQKQQVFI